MKRALSLFVITCLMICSCKSKSGQQPASSDQVSSDQVSSDQTEAPTGMAATILSFYKAYCTEFDGESKTDSILSAYCTDELREYVMDCVGEYDFVLNGGIYSEIHSESFRVVKRNEKYVVYFEYTPWPVRDEPAKDSVYVMVNKENKISYIIRPEDNYRVPTSYASESLYNFEDYEFVDLGLSVNWATFNVGGRKYDPNWHGDFFAWGETEARKEFVQNYYLEPKQGHYYDGKLNVIESCDDAATVLWGKDWRMPTKEEFQELIDKCEWEWMEQSYHWGYKVTGQNGNSIFLPAGGMKMERRWINESSGLYYWTSTCKFDDPEREPKAWQFVSVSDGPDKSQNRNMILTLVPLSIQSGRSIRPVTTKQYVPISDIILNRTELKMEVGDDYILSAAFIPEDATKRNIYWHSGNSAVAYVDRNGKVTGVSGGKCTITAVCGEFKQECQVKVIQPRDYVPVKPEKVITIYEFGKEVNDSLIDGFWKYDDSAEELEEVFKAQIGNKADDITVTLYGYTSEGWKNDPGDYSVISIESAGKKYQFKNPDWEKRVVFDNNYFYCHPMGKSRYLLFFKGWGDCCSPGILTILAIDETGARTVFNKDFDISEINRDPFSMTIEDDYEYDEIKYKPHFPNAYNLYIEDGALKMKKVNLLRE